MTDLQQLKDQLVAYEAERDRILRGLGIRYSRRFKNTNGLAVKRSQKGIKAAKKRLNAITVEIVKLTRKIDTLEALMHSTNVNAVFEKAIADLQG